MWYAHAGTTVLRLSKAPTTWKVAKGRRYDDRGWCTFELVCSMIAKHWACTLDYAKFDGKTVESMVGERMVPMHPDDFESLILKKSFAVAKDNLMVFKLYSKVCKAVLGAATSELDFSKKTWKDEDFAALARSLGLATQLSGKLRLNRTHMSAADAKLFFGALDAKALPLLQELDLSDNPLGDEGAIVVAEALSAGKMPALSRLHIYTGTKVGLKGKSALAKVRRGESLHSGKPSKPGAATDGMSQIEAATKLQAIQRSKAARANKLAVANKPATALNKRPSGSDSGNKKEAASKGGAPALSIM